MHYEMIWTFLDLCRHCYPAFSSSKTYTEVSFVYCPYIVFLTSVHSHNYNKEESKTALYGTKITVPECTVCPAANHANALTHHSLLTLAHTHISPPHPNHTHVDKNTYTQQPITDVHTEVTATTAYTVLR